MAIWGWCGGKLDLNLRLLASRTADASDCALLEGELASALLAALREQRLWRLAVQITPNGDLPNQAVQQFGNAPLPFGVCAGQCRPAARDDLTGRCPIEYCEETVAEIKEKYNKAKIFTDAADSASIAQVQKLCNQDFTAGSRIRPMPDIHTGRGCTIGPDGLYSKADIPEHIRFDTKPLAEFALSIF